VRQKRTADLPNELGEKQKSLLASGTKTAEAAE
jgi:hypothetical protein